jgi:hypothetical protein
MSGTVVGARGETVAAIDVMAGLVPAIHALLIAVL